MAQQQQASAREYTYTIVLTPDEEGGYVVTVPTLPGCITDGDTVEEAREHAAEAITGYIEALVAEGEPIPVDSGNSTSDRQHLVTVRAPGR